MEDMFKQIYRYDEDTDEFILEMALNHFHELFHEWDASTIRKKDLDPDLVDFLVEAVTDLPKDANIAILFKLSSSEPDPKLEDIAQNALHNYFDFKIHLSKRQVNRFLRRALSYLMIGFSFILGATLLDQVLDRITFNVLTQGLFIGGWVFIWESVSLLFFKIRGLRQDHKRYEKIKNATIYFKYQPQENQLG